MQVLLVLSTESQTNIHPSVLTILVQSTNLLVDKLDSFNTVEIPTGT